MGSSVEPGQWHARAAATRRQRSEQRIRRAARELLAERGYESTTVKMIAAQAGVGAATIYNIFGGKRSLAAQVLAEALAPLVAIAEREAETLPVESAIEAHLTRLAKVLQQHSDLVPGTLAISRSAPPFWLPEASPGPRQINSLTAPLRTLIRAGQRRGEIETDLDPVECAEMITGLLVVVSHERREPAPAAARLVARVTLRGLLTDRPAADLRSATPS